MDTKLHIRIHFAVNLKYKYNSKIVSTEHTQKNEWMALKYKIIHTSKKTFGIIHL